MVTSSPVGTGASPRLQNLIQNKRLSTGSYGCVREVLHPLDPRAEPTALLYYDSSSDDELSNDFIRQRGMQDKPTKRRLSFGTDAQPKKLAAEPARKTSVYSPSTSRVPRRQAFKESSPFRSPQHGQVGLDEVTSDKFLERFATSISVDAQSLLHTPQRSVTGSPDGAGIYDWRSELRSPYTKAHLPGTKAPDNTPFAGPSGLVDLDREALGDEIKKCLQLLESEGEDKSTQEIIARMEALLRGLREYSDVESDKYDKYDTSIQFVIKELTRIGVIQPAAAQKLLMRCQKWTTRMSQIAIMSRWLVHERLYEDTNEGSTQDWTPQSTPGFLSPEPRSHGASPSSPFSFRSPKQQDYSPLQSRNFYTPSRRSLRRRSDMADSIATLREKLYRLQCNSDSLGDARKLHASREHEISMKYHYGRAAEPTNKVKDEMTLDTQLQRLLEQRKAQEEAVRQAQLRAEAEARMEAARQEEMKMHKLAAEAAAQQRERRITEEAKRQQQEEETARKKAQEEADKQAKEEAIRREYLEKKAAEETAVAEAAIVKPQATKAPIEAVTEYGRKNFEVENTEMKNLLAALKEVRLRVAQDRDLFKKVNAKKRAVNPKLGQLNGENQQTNLVRNFFLSTLSDMKEEGGPQVDAATFQLNHDPRIEGKPPTKVPLVFIWMINELGKMVVRQVETESSVAIKTANPIGVAVVSALARDPLLANGRSFIDIIVARLWKKCPILQGVLGPEDTPRAREALGWIKTKPGDQWEGDEAHVNRMVGYTAGFAAIGGRNFMGTQALMNPYPPFNLWFLLAYFANNPDKLTNTHFFCIKTMLEVAGDTIRKVYGREGEKLVTIILTELAEYGVKKKYAGGLGLQALGAKFERDKKFL